MYQIFPLFPLPRSKFWSRPCLASQISGFRKPHKAFNHQTRAAFIIHVDLELMLEPIYERNNTHYSFNATDALLLRLSCVFSIPNLTIIDSNTFVKMRLLLIKLI